ncbi:MAG TPA: hypothetical protein VFO19_22560 [Vicinamibacterales bacterium]|nr:hypothetical protein [Vicinamibacterales bacterium]
MTAHLRLTAAADLAAALPPLALPNAVSSPDTPAWWRRWRSPLRVPRFGAAIVTVALVVSSVGWFRAETGSRVVHQLRAEIITACDDPAGGRITSKATLTAIVGSRSTFYTSDPCHPGGGGLLGVVDPVSLNNGVVKLKLGAIRSAGLQGAAPDLTNLQLKDFDYIPGEEVRVPVDGSPTTATFVGQITQRIGTDEPVSMASLLPREGELTITMPAMLDDGKTVVVTTNAGGTARAGQAIAIYAPGHGLFVFSLDNFAEASQAQAAGATIAFVSSGRRYTLYSSLPITSGAQPRTIWFRHLADYRPSTRGASGGSDDLPGLRIGDAATLSR